MSFKIAIFAPSNIFRYGLVNILEQQDYFSLVECFENEDVFITKFLSLQPDACLIDYNLFRKTGLKDFFHKTNSVYYTRCIFVADTIDEYDLYYVNLINGSGIIHKDIQDCHLCELLLKALKKSQFVSNFTTLQNVEAVIEKLKQRIKIKHSDIDILTRMEIKIIQDYGLGYSTRMIADKYCLAKDTVDTHRRKIMQKFNLLNKDDFLLNAKHFINLFHKNIEIEESIVQ